MDVHLNSNGDDLKTEAKHSAYHTHKTPSCCKIPPDTGASPNSAPFGQRSPLFASPYAEGADYRRAEFQPPAPGFGIAHGLAKAE